MGSGSWIRGSGFGVWVWDSGSRVRVYALGLFLRLGCRRSEFWGVGVSKSGVMGEGLGPSSIRPPETQSVAGSVEVCCEGGREQLSRKIQPTAPKKVQHQGVASDQTTFDSLHDLPTLQTLHCAPPQPPKPHPPLLRCASATHPLPLAYRTCCRLRRCRLPQHFRSIREPRRPSLHPLQRVPAGGSR